MERKQLIELCEKAIVEQEYWRDRDSGDAQMQIGQAWALLKAGCNYKIEEENADFITIAISYKGFRYFELDELDQNNFYIPTEKRLNSIEKGMDWY